jgi:predicted metal-dependent phosphoesterase TrpH
MIENCKTFTFTFHKDQERTYIRIPVQVGSDMESLSVSYDYQRRCRVEEGPGRERLTEINIIDLALEDPNHVLVGASGSERKCISIHENYATPGYRPAPVTEGTWHVLLGLYLLEETGCTVTLTVMQTPKEPVLLKGDTHLHTGHSDGWYTVEETVARARQDRLDYIFITDHNCMTSNAYLPCYPDLTVLPGVEMTYYDGHYNLLGVQRPVKTFFANGREEVLAIMREGRQSGALSSVNHPMDGPCGWKFGLSEDVPVDLIEIWNGPFTPENAAAVRLWHNELCKGRHLPAIGGSDAHRGELFRQMATPATFLYSRSRSKSDILDALKLGHAFVGMTPDAPGLDLQLGSARMGDTASLKDGETLQMTFSNLRAGDEVRLYNETGLVWKETPGAYARFEAERPAKGSLFMRTEVWRPLPGIGMTLASIGNPVYIAK